MADLWIFGRKPAAMVRHRHGGFNATFPMNGDTVVEQAGRTRDMDAAREQAERSAAELPPRIEGREAQNVLSFQPRGRGTQRGGHKPRQGGRPAPYRD
ncbi:hypothetical protein HH303_15190 [Rhodospirillaceae bacterium KN72]|uniref:Uncharacterized protein n=1 Tax=Pacificispira spongiicola TaxID=2729598 RepID=A0A7Y0E264_9PROT|nr:hypothetical protein [Pacificispira spongiicola]NMM45840.1 hypothetical protein [Pacificispira spongiicola]